MHTVTELTEIVRRALESLELPEQPKELYEPIRYSLSMGGKRIRPVLTLMACELFGGRADDALMPAIGIEVFHNFTLVHDDIMDNAPTRRGHESVFRKWNPNIAILSGDTMFALACEMISKTKPDLLLPVLTVFNTTAKEVCEGQQYDMNFEKLLQVSTDDYLRMIRLKTAVLLGCSLKIGAIAGGAPTEEAELLYRFGESLGMAFQIRDDLLDTFGDERLFGKKTGGDIISNKKTFLFVTALERSGPEARKALLQLYSEDTGSAEEKILKVKNLFVQNGVKETAETVMEKYYRDAMSFLGRLSPARHKKQPLEDFAAGIMNRQY